MPALCLQNMEQAFLLALNKLILVFMRLIYRLIIFFAE